MHTAGMRRFNGHIRRDAMVLGVCVRRRSDRQEEHRDAERHLPLAGNGNGYSEILYKTMGYPFSSTETAIREAAGAGCSLSRILT